MFRGAKGREGGRGLTSVLIALVLVLQSLASAPCEARAVSDPHATAHACADAGGGEPTDPDPGRQTQADACCMCLTPAATPPSEPRPSADLDLRDVAAPRYCAAGLAPLLRPIASGPPSQAPPASV